MTYNIVFQRRASLAEEELIRGRTKLRFVNLKKGLLILTFEKHGRRYSIWLIIHVELCSLWLQASREADTRCNSLSL